MNTWRSAVLEEAATWLGTPYHHQAHVKGHGVDCVWLLIEVYKTIGAVPADFDPGFYTTDWYLHHSEELYMNGVERYARRLAADEAAAPGDIALFKVGYCVSHGAIYLGDNRIIHANRVSRKVEIGTIGEDGRLLRSLHSFWTPNR